MAHIDAAHDATLAAGTLAPTAAALWRPAVNVYETGQCRIEMSELPRPETPDNPAVPDLLPTWLWSPTSRQRACNWWTQRR
jgi:hypothetical protein